MYENVDYVACIQTVESENLKNDPSVFPQEGKVYTLIAWRQDANFDNEFYLTLEELGDNYEWHSAFFRPIDSAFMENLIPDEPKVLKEYAKMENV